jgi:hypothetical protein
MYTLRMLPHMAATRRAAATIAKLVSTQYDILHQLRLGI